MSIENEIIEYLIRENYNVVTPKIMIGIDDQEIIFSKNEIERLIDIGNTNIR